jgi:DNA polymerase/3'-5' exonuclease PolX
MMPSSPTDKPRFPRAAALAVAKEICLFLKPHCAPFPHGPDGVALIVAGSLRRRKESVGDVEILYIPRVEPVKEFRQSDLLAEQKPRLENKVDSELESLARTCVITARKNINGSVVWGPKNKLARHVASGIPIDFFSATPANWFNYLVCRTGGAQNNVRIASAAQSKGWQWHPYGSGFTDQEGNLVRVESEQDVFRLAGLPYLEPWQR